MTAQVLARIPAPRVGILVLFVVLLLASAWMHDDAYITFRCIDNLLSGHGLTWNPDERVQAYTHPLWMSLHTLLFAVTGEAYFTSLAASIALSITTVWLFLFRLPGLLKSPITVICGVGFLLLSCKSFVEYSTSGLENPLSHFLLMIFALVLFRDPSRESFFLLSLIAALATVNRPDTILLYLPTLAAVFLRQRSIKSLWSLVLGFLPLLLWELFSLVYYGFLLPNTAYAKLGTGAPRWAMVQQGFDYLFYSLISDPMTGLLLACAIYVVTRRRDPRQAVLLAGCGLYLAYVLWIGGDYMRGRFLSTPTLAAAIIVAGAEWRKPSQRQTVAGWVLISLLLTGSALAPFTESWFKAPGASDERRRFYHATGLLNSAFSDQAWPDHYFRRKGEYLRRNGPNLVVDAYVGMLGFYAGPEVHIVDLLSLPDPLLARLPGTTEKGQWTPGHVPRPLPEGYLKSLETGTNQLADPNLVIYYDKIRRVTRGPLWTGQRWTEILRFQSGANDPLVEAYVRDNPEAFSNPREELPTLFTVDDQLVLDQTHF